MVGQEEQIERIVREVLARLNGHGEAKSDHQCEPCRKGAVTADPCPCDKTTTARQEPRPSQETLELSTKVVTLAELESRLDGVRSLIVRRGAVVTPAVRDLLRQKKIDLAYQARSQPSAAQSFQLAVAVTETKYDAAAMLRAVAESGVGIQRLANSGLVTVIDELADAVAKGGQLGLLMTGQPAAGLCLANRHRGVRAAMGDSVQVAAEAVRSLGANLLVVNPAGRGVFELKRTIKEFCSAGPRECPADYRSRLG